MKDGERSLPLIPFSHSFSSRAAESSISMKYESSVAAGILQQQCRRTTLSPGSSLPFRLSSDNFPPFELLAREEKQKGPKSLTFTLRNIIPLLSNGGLGQILTKCRGCLGAREGRRGEERASEGALHGGLERSQTRVAFPREDGRETSST